MHVLHECVSEDAAVLCVFLHVTGCYWMFQLQLVSLMTTRGPDTTSEFISTDFRVNMSNFTTEMNTLAAWSRLTAVALRLLVSAISIASCQSKDHSHNNINIPLISAVNPTHCWYRPLVGIHGAAVTLFYFCVELNQT